MTQIKTNSIKFSNLTNFPTGVIGKLIMVNNKLYIYISTPGSWSTKADMPTARYALTSSPVNDKIYAIGGYGGGEDKNEEYNPSTNSWSTRADMPTARHSLTSSPVSGRIYAIGGYYDLSINEEYTPGFTGFKRLLTG